MPEDKIDVLLVEDNPGDARLVRVAFEEVETETTIRAVSTADEAIAHLTRRAESDTVPLPDLALVDLNLPGTDGDELVERIRDSDRFQRLPVIVLTSSTADEDVARCYGATANAYLTKPTDIDEFVRLAEAVEEFWFRQAQLPSVVA